MRIKQILIVILLSLFLFPLNVFADDNDVIVKSIELLSKSENVEELSQASASGTNINLNIKLYDPKDYIEYNLLIKNNSQDEYTFDDSKLETSDDYLNYKFSYTETSNVLKPGEERNVKLTITYINKVPQDKLKNDSFVSESIISLTLNDNVITPSIVNPETGLTNPIVYIIFMFVSLIGILATLKISKKIKIITIILTSLLVLPIYTIANKKIDIKLNANITIDGKEAFFLPGKDFNIKVKQLASGDTSIDEIGKINTNINKIAFSDAIDDCYKTENNIVSKNDSPYPIYAWFDSNTLYIWSDDKTPNLNEDSSTMFANFSELLDITGLKTFDTSKVNNMKGMFQSSYISTPMKIGSLKPLKNWDVSNVTNMAGLFQANYGIRELDGLEDWNTKNVKSLYLTFSYCNNLENLKALSKWDTSSVENMSNTFINLPSLTTLEGLENWKTDNVTTMKFLFLISENQIPTGYTSKLEDVSALTNWNTSNVTDMLAMFQNNSSIKSLDALKNWNTSKINDFRNFCRGCSSLTSAEGIYDFNTINATKYGNMLTNTDQLIEFDLTNYNFTNVTSTTDANIIYKANSLKKIKTPKAYPTDVNVKINLPYAFCDSDNNQYLKLDNTSPTQTWLTKCE